MVIMIDLAGRLCFFIRAVVGLAIGGAVLIERKVAVSFYKLSLW